MGGSARWQAPFAESCVAKCAAPESMLMVMDMRLSLCIAMGVALASGHAATPIRYDMTASIEGVPVSGGASFGTKFFFESGNRVVYHVIPRGQTDGDPAASWKYWSVSAGSRDILPAAGYASLNISALANGRAIGNSVTESPSHKEAALAWTVDSGPQTPAGFDAGYSGLNAVNSMGFAAGFTDSGVFKIVRWDAANPGAGVTEIVPPAGCTSPQVAGVSGAGEVLLCVTDAGGKVRAAIWDGSASTLIGPVPTGTFYPSNCAIDSGGDVAMLEFTAGGAAKLHFITASDRTAWKTFTFAGPVDSSAYNLRVSSAGIASFDTSISGINTVAIASAARDMQATFGGYRSYLNNAGTLIFGDQGNLNYWDASAWIGQPSVVTVSATSNSGGLDVVGFSDEGHVLVLIAAQSTRSLGILTPAFAQPTSVNLAPARKITHLQVGVRARKPLVKMRVSGDALDGRVRYTYRGKLPDGMKFRHSEAIISGTPLAPKSFTLRIGATYTTGGVKKETPLVKVKIVIRPR